MIYLYLFVLTVLQYVYSVPDLLILSVNFEMIVIIVYAHLIFCLNVLSYSNLFAERPLFVYHQFPTNMGQQLPTGGEGSQ